LRDIENAGTTCLGNLLKLQTLLLQNLLKSS
jgi:hypothetical protein